MQLTRKKFVLALLACFTPKLLGQEKKKFYITGLAHTETANDCTIPPIVAYGTDRVDALLHCCDGGGLTVWTEEEWENARKTSGKDFDKFCAEKAKLRR